jgi:hypothetical protein
LVCDASHPFGEPENLMHDNHCGGLLFHLGKDEKTSHVAVAMLTSTHSPCRGDFSSFSFAQSCAKSGELKKISAANDAAIREMAVRMLIKGFYALPVRLPIVRSRLGETPPESCAHCRRDGVTSRRTRMKTGRPVIINMATRRCGRDGASGKQPEIKPFRGD